MLPISTWVSLPVSVVLSFIYISMSNYNVHDLSALEHQDLLLKVVLFKYIDIYVLQMHFFLNIIYFITYLFIDTVIYLFLLCAMENLNP